MPSIAGSIGVGKTSLLHRYTQKNFDPRNMTSTTGAFFVTKKVHVDGLKVRLQLWDTAGQERFRSMVRTHFHSLTSRYSNQHNQAPMYYRGANAALLLYDITNAATFDDIRGWLAGVCRCISLWRLFPDSTTACFRVKEKLPAGAYHLYRWF